MKKILITGSNGLLGQKLLNVLDSDVDNLVGIDLTNESFIKNIPHQYHRLDLTNRKLTSDCICTIEPQVIIHTAAMTAVDKCEIEKEACWKVNVNATDHIISAAQKIKAKVIFISSDYIFNGKKGPYREDDLPDPVGYYGKSKLAAENMLRGSSLDWAIVRTIVLYGVGIKVRASFVTWLLKELRAQKSVNIVNDQWSNTTMVDDLAAGIMRIIDLERSGIYNIAGKGYLNRYEFALKIAEFFELNPDLIHPISTKSLNQSAKRPMRSGLEIDKAERELYLSFRTVDQALKLYKHQEEQ